MYILCMLSRLSLQAAERVSTHIFGDNISSLQNDSSLARNFRRFPQTFRCFFGIKRGSFHVCPVFSKRPMPGCLVVRGLFLTAFETPEQTGLLLLVTYLILAILYFFEGAGKDHSLAVLE